MVKLNPVTGLASAPVFATWYSTLRCNLSCLHCFVPVTDSDALVEDELTTAEAIALIDQLADSEVYQLAFAGGEPLLRRDFFMLAAYARGKGMTIQVSTNGLNFPEEGPKLLKDIGFKCIQISLDGVTEAENQVIRGKGNFEKTLSAIRQCVAEDIPVILAYSVHKKNKGNLKALVEFAIKEKISTVKLQPICTPFKYRSGKENGELSRSEALDVITEAETLFQATNIKLTITSSAEMYAGRIDQKHCYFTNAIIFPNGEVGTCDQAPELAEGNLLLKNGFLKSWDNAVKSTLSKSTCGCVLETEQ